MREFTFDLQARQRRFLVVLTMAITAMAAQCAHASCNIQIVSAGPCLANGSPGIPSVGDEYGLNLVMNVSGTPSAPFRIKWTIANVVYYYTNVTLGPGNGYVWDFAWTLDLDGQIPWSVTIDPDGVSGNTNPVKTASGKFTPVPPTTAVDLYDSTAMSGTESSNIAFEPGSGTISNLWVIFGKPGTHGAQVVSKVTPPAHCTAIATPPNGVSVFQIARENVAAADFVDTETFDVTTSNMRVNPKLLGAGTWAQIKALPTSWEQWVAPDQICESTDPSITAFVQKSLPADYLTTQSPYTTARALHKAVERALTYMSPPLYGDAVNVLKEGSGDCGGFAALLVACLRNVGIPARCIYGFWQGTDQWHARVEFHLPGVQWLMADADEGNANDPTGTYAYDFGYVPDANEYMAVDVGDSHELPYYDFTYIQIPNWIWTGGAINESYTATATFGAAPVAPSGTASSH